MKDSKLKRLLVKIYERFYEFRRMAILRTCYRLRIMSPEKTLRYIAKKKCSIARYGDGEFDLIFQKKDLHFQLQNNHLASKLAEVFDMQDKRLLLCVPRCFNSIKGCNDHASKFWIEWGRQDDYHKHIVNLIRARTGAGYLFGDSQITRPYIDWKNSKRAKKTFPMLKALWADRDIIIIEGEQTRMGVGNDLFNDARSVKRILAPAVGAFEYIEDIQNTVVQNYCGELLIIALGPTATVLVAEFAAMDMQALDIGHIDIEYEWYLRGVTERMAVPGKFTNEILDGRNRVSACDDKTYLSQIVARVGCQ